MTELDSDTWVGEVKRIRGKKLPLTAAGVHGSRDEYTRTLEPARALVAETLTLERTHNAECAMRSAEWSCLAHGLTPAEIALTWKTVKITWSGQAGRNSAT